MNLIENFLRSCHNFTNYRHCKSPLSPKNGFWKDKMVYIQKESSEEHETRRVKEKRFRQNSLSGSSIFRL